MLNSNKYRRSRHLWHLSEVPYNPQILAGLLDRGSLTERVVCSCNGQFRVEVLRQEMARPTMNDARLLRIPAGRYAVIREVRLLCNERPLVFAHTVIPLSTLSGQERRLRRLGSKPLGATLFADPNLQRGPLLPDRLRPDSKRYALAVAGLDERPAIIPGRRSIFHLHQKPLLVCEYFLPTEW